jgi:PAS domain S-box-containing protein
MEEISRTTEELIEEIAALSGKIEELQQSDRLCKEAEQRQHLTAEILGILNDPTGLTDAIRRILLVIKGKTDFEAVGIRLRVGDDFPYFVQEGFSDEFLLAENSLVFRTLDGQPCRGPDGNLSLECTCGLVLSGKTDPSNPLFTTGGSAWTNNSLPLLELPADQDPRFHPRNRCIHEDFLSVALIPIRSDQEIIGLLQLNDRQADRLNLEMIQYLEGISASIGVALQRKQMEEELKESQERYSILFNNHHTVMLLIDPETGSLVDANPAACSYYGYSLSELKSKKITDINILTPEEVFLEMNAAKAEQRNLFYFQHRLADSEIRPVEVYSGPIIIKGKKILYSIIHDISQRKKAEAEKERLIQELQEALSKIKTLSGFLPICSSCKKIRDDQGYWQQIESYIRDHSEAEFSHGICPDCAKKLYPTYIKPK